MAPTPDVLSLLAVIIAALAGSLLAAVAGFGGAVILLPVLVWVFGARDAVPILTVVQLIGNLSRVYVNRTQLAWPVVGWFSLGAIPATLLGAILFTLTPSPILSRFLGAFLLVSVGLRHTPALRSWKPSLRSFAGVGAGVGFLSALIGSAGPISGPFFLSFGLIRGAYIGSEALTAVLMHVMKLGVYGGYALVSATSLVYGLAIGLVMIAGTLLGKRLLDRAPEALFPRIVEVALVMSGISLIVWG